MSKSIELLGTQLVSQELENWLLVWEKKEMAPHSSILAWKILWTGEPGELKSMGSQGVRRDWVTAHTEGEPCVWSRGVVKRVQSSHLPVKESGLSRNQTC